MKYIIIIILCLVLSSCDGGQLVINYAEEPIVTEISTHEKHCHYTINSVVEFADSCGKFQIGDKVTTCKKN